MLQYNLTGKTALVTGVSRKNSIGYAVARQLANNGVDLLLHSFQAYDIDFIDLIGREAISRPEELSEELLRSGSKVEHFDTDFNHPDSVSQLFEYADQKFDHIDILIINHTYDTLKTLDDLDVSEIDNHLHVNIRAPLLMIKHFQQRFVDKKGGRVILLTSGQHLGPMPHLAYVASKGALHHLTLSLSDMLISKGITVNAVNPGPTKTYIPSKEVDQEVLKRMPQGRWGVPEDAARLITWLVSDEASWITGQIIDSEGGFRRG